MRKVEGVVKTGVPVRYVIQVFVPGCINTKLCLVFVSPNNQPDVSLGLARPPISVMMVDRVVLTKQTGYYQGKV